MCAIVNTYAESVPKPLGDIMNNTLTAETIAHFACDYAYAREIGNRHTLDYIDNEIGKCDEETYKQFRMCVASIAAFQLKQQFTRKQLGA